MLLNTRIVAVGPEVESLAENGVVILFAEGAPPELAEVSVLHAVQSAASGVAPKIGSSIHIGNVSAMVTAVGSTAWQKVLEMGHVVINFNDAKVAERPGEICATVIAPIDLSKNLKVGQTITIS
jgi:glucitol/sorbitol PTS system EIIA component